MTKLSPDTTDKGWTILGEVICTCGEPVPLKVTGSEQLKPVICKILEMNFTCFSPIKFLACSKKLWSWSWTTFARLTKILWTRLICGTYYFCSRFMDAVFNRFRQLPFNIAQSAAVGAFRSRLLGFSNSSIHLYTFHLCHPPMAPNHVVSLLAEKTNAIISRSPLKL